MENVIIKPKSAITPPTIIKSTIHFVASELINNGATINAAAATEKLLCIHG